MQIQPLFANIGRMILLILIRSLLTQQSANAIRKESPVIGAKTATQLIILYYLLTIHINKLNPMVHYFPSISLKLT